MTFSIHLKWFMDTHVVQLFIYIRIYICRVLVNFTMLLLTRLVLIPIFYIQSINNKFWLLLCTYYYQIQLDYGEYQVVGIKIVDEFTNVKDDWYLCMDEAIPLFKWAIYLEECKDYKLMHFLQYIQRGYPVEHYFKF